MVSLSGSVTGEELAEDKEMSISGPGFDSTSPHFKSSKDRTVKSLKIESR